MIIIPLVLSFDNNLVVPAGVCLSSLFVNSDKNTYYDIYILHNNLSNSSKLLLSKLHDVFDCFEINYIDVGNAFDDGFEVRGITIAAYYRLLIPEVIIKYDKIIYSDVDVIFKEGLSEIYNKTHFNGEYVAAVKAVLLEENDLNYIRSIGCEEYKYVNSGFLIFNSKLMRTDKIIDKFSKLVGNKYLYQDQDIINIICKGRIKILPPRYTFSQGAYRYSNNFDYLKKIFTIDEINEAKEFGIVHYNGKKPWLCFCYRYHLWWLYYQNSIFMDDDFILKTELDIIKRINYSIFDEFKMLIKRLIKR